MKKLFSALFIAAIACGFAAPASAANPYKDSAIKAAKKEMREFLKVRKTSTDFEVPGYTLTIVDKKVFMPKAERKGNFLRRVGWITKAKIAQWAEYVDENSGEDGEFEGLSSGELEEIKKNPLQHTLAADSGYLIEFSQFHEVKNSAGRTIGYIVETTDHVQAAIYQDGAGIYFFIDKNFNVVKTEDWSA